MFRILDLDLNLDQSLLRMSTPDPALAPDPLRRTRVFGLCVLAFLLMLSYALARPATESLFIKAHTSEGLPLAWLLVSAGMVAVVLLYNRAVRRMRLMRLMCAVALISLASLAALLLASARDLPGVYYMLYVWKDIYMVVLVEVFYSFSNSVFPLQRARWYYGLFGVVGAVGGVAGNLLTKHWVEQIGTAWALALTAPVLLAIAAAAVVFDRRAGQVRASGEGAPAASISGYLRSMWHQSPYLMLILALIALVQVVMTMLDFEFNQVVELAYPLTDARTGAMSLVYAAVSVGTIALHGGTGPVLRLAGVPATLLLIPVVLGGGFSVYALVPVFATVAVVKVCSKCLDYTLFRHAKELLYIPLSYQDRTQGKALVDMLTYRVAKGGASLLLLGLISLDQVALVKHLTFALLGAWLLVTVIISRRFRRQVSRQQEMEAGG